MSEFKKGGNFSKGPRSGGFNKGGFSRPSFGGGSRPSGRDQGERTETFKATCSKCRAACDVPFRPNGKKPVYCKDCFVRDDARPTSNSFEKRSYGPERPSPRHAAPVEDPRIGAMQKELAAVHAKLDTLILTLEGAAYSSILAGSVAKAEKPKKEEKAATAKKAAKKKSA